MALIAVLVPFRNAVHAEPLNVESFAVPSFSAEIILPKNSPVPASSLNLFPEQTTATLEGDWVARANSTLPPGKIPFPALTFHVPAEIPSDLGVGDKNSISLSKKFKKFVFDIPAPPGGDKRAEFNLDLPGGRVVLLVLKWDLHLEKNKVLTAPECLKQSVELISTDIHSPKDLYLLNCGITDSPLVIVVQPLAGFTGKQPAPGSTVWMNKSHALLATFPPNPGTSGRTLLSFEGYSIRQSSNWAKNWYRYGQLSEQVMFQGSGGSSYTGKLSWNPTFAFSRSWGMRGNLGISLLKGATQGSSFVAAEYEVLGVYSGLNPFLLELGGGAQTWFGLGGTGPMFSGEVAWKLPQKFLHFVDRVYVGYGAFFYTLELTHEVNLGIGLVF